MKPKQNDPLESWASETLRQIPDRRAPAALSRRVMAEIQRRAATPWYARPWLEWNPAAKAGSLVALPALGYGLWGVALPALREAIGAASITREAASTLGAASVMGEAALSVGRAGWLTLSQVQPLYLACLAGMFAVAWISTLTLGTAAWRLARRND
jgi:hypothetical protein